MHVENHHFCNHHSKDWLNKNSSVDVQSRGESVMRTQICTYSYSVFPRTTKGALYLSQGIISEASDVNSGHLTLLLSSFFLEYTVTIFPL